MPKLVQTISDANNSIPKNPEISSGKTNFSWEKEESPTGSAKDMNTNDPFLGPEELSGISIADLLTKVKEKYENYLLENEKSQDTTILHLGLAGAGNGNRTLSWWIKSIDK